MAPALAQKIALGDADPVTGLPMEDINPSYIPRSVRPLPLDEHDVNQPSPASARKAKVKAHNGSILNFLAPKAKSSPAPRSVSHPQPVVQKIVAGRASGKRTLADVMDQDLSAKRKKQDSRSHSHHRRPSSPSPLPVAHAASLENLPPRTLAQSRFFGAAAGPSRRHSAPMPVHDVIVVSSDGEEEEEVFGMRRDEEEEEDVDFDVPDEDRVGQEDGYISPAASLTRMDTPELSSPPRPLGDDGDFGADVEVLSSPERTRERCRSSLGRQARVLVEDTPTKPKGKAAVDLQVEPRLRGPELFTSSDVEVDEEEEEGVRPPQCSFGSAGSSTPPSRDSMVDMDVFEVEVEEAEVRREVVAQGWWDKWARSGRKGVAGGGIRVGQPLSTSKTAMRRRETTVTAEGRHQPFRFHPQSAPGKSGVQGSWTATPRGRGPSGRKSLVFSEQKEEEVEEVVAGGARTARGRVGGCR
ncbi:hypothetical protein OF83DRAFT_822217 [Amylostereum chailletii]|nr:hypothetical protein OF83DRAFT_822217 [Amylostereum chailletii]